MENRMNRDADAKMPVPQFSRPVSGRRQDIRTCTPVMPRDPRNGHNQMESERKERPAVMKRNHLSAAVCALLFCLGLCLNDLNAGEKWNGQFYLVDQRTQMPVLTCRVQPTWAAGGKTTWTAEPSMPVVWYIWAMRPDLRAKIIISSSVCIPSLGQIRQSPPLQNPSMLANMLLKAVQKDYNLSDVRLAEARFNPQQADPKLLNARMLQAQQRGIQLTNYLFTELFIRYEGTCGGERRTVLMSLPILALESRVSMSFTTMLELMLPMSFSCPAGEEQATQKELQAILPTLQLNPNFTALVNQISAQRTSEWLRMQSEIRNRQFELSNSTSQTMDRVRDKWSEYIRDVDSVSNPNTGEKMFVDSRYDHAWINSSNEIIYHNSGFNTPNASTATFDPNSNALFNHTNWTKLK